MRWSSNQDDVVEQRPVQIGALIDGMRVIEQGVSADDWVVVEGIQRAIPGSKVAPQRMEPAPAAPASPPEAAASTDGTPAAAPAAAPAPATQR